MIFGCLRLDLLSRRIMQVGLKPLPHHKIQGTKSGRIIKITPEEMG